MAETKKTTTKKSTTPATSKSTSSSKTSSSQKTTTKTTTTKKAEPTQSSNNRKPKHSHGNGIKTWGLNKISFYAIGAVAILYLIASVLALCGLNLKVVSALQGFATAVVISIVAFLAWKYVRNKQTVWKVLYFVLLLVVLLGVILPLVA